MKFVPFCFDFFYRKRSVLNSIMFIRASKIKSFLHPKKSLVFPSLRILIMNRTAVFWYSGSLSRIRILLGLRSKSILVWLSLLESTTVFSCAGLSARFRSQNLANLERKGNALRWNRPRSGLPSFVENFIVFRRGILVSSLLDSFIEKRVSIKPPPRVHVSVRSSDSYQ